MATSVIEASGVGKRYTLARREPYASLRETISSTITGLLTGRGRTRRSAAETFWALKDVSFKIDQGEAVGIVGRNGAGKSTLLKVLSRITEPTEGRIVLRGRVASLLEVGTGFHPELTGRENIYLNGAILGMSRAEIDRRFEEIVAFAEVEKFLDTAAKHYSSGMYMRLAFSVAAHLEPEILLVDEVLAVGDAAFQKKCLHKMEDVSHHGRTVLFVSHNVMAITRLCRRAVWLDGGRMIDDGAADKVVGRYLRQGTSTTAARAWPDLRTAPGSDPVRLTGVRVVDKNGNVAESIDIRDPVRIEIEYHNYSTHRFPYANLQIFDENGTCLFVTGDYVNRQWRHAPRNFTGTVKSVCTIPGNFLAEGQLSVLVALTTQAPDEMLVHEPDAVTFTVVDNSVGDGARGDYVGPFPGVVRPLLAWEVAHDRRTE